jgi:hypothetical protein
MLGKETIVTQPLLEAVYAQEMSWHQIRRVAHVPVDVTAQIEFMYNWFDVGLRQGPAEANSNSLLVFLKKFPPPFDLCKLTPISSLSKGLVSKAPCIL